MADLTVSADVDAMLSAANNAAIVSAIGAAAASHTHAATAITSGNLARARIDNALSANPAPGAFTTLTATGTITTGSSIAGPEGGLTISSFGASLNLGPQGYLGGSTGFVFTGPILCGTIYSGYGTNIHVTAGSVIVYDGGQFRFLNAGFALADTNVIGVTNGSTGGGILEFQQVAAIGTPSTDSARLGALDNAGTAALYTKNEAGTEAILSPHAGDAPEWIYDETAFGQDHVRRETNDYTRQVRFTNETRRARLTGLMLEAQLGDAVATAELAALSKPARKFVHEESFDEYETRTGKALDSVPAEEAADWKTATPAERWDKTQAKHIARREAERAEWADRKAEAEKAEKPFAEPQPEPLTAKEPPAFVQTKKPKPEKGPKPK